MELFFPQNVSQDCCKWYERIFPKETEHRSSKWYSFFWYYNISQNTRDTGERLFTLSCTKYDSLFNSQLAFPVFVSLSLYKESVLKPMSVLPNMHPTMLTVSFIHVSFLQKVCLWACFKFTCTAQKVMHLMQKMYQMHVSRTQHDAVRGTSANTIQNCRPHYTSSPMICWYVSLGIPASTVVYHSIHLNCYLSSY